MYYGEFENRELGVGVFGDKHIAFFFTFTEQA